MDILPFTGQSWLQCVIIIGVGIVFSAFAFSAKFSHRGPRWLYAFIIVAAGLGVLLSPLPAYGQWYMVVYIGLLLSVVAWAISWMPFLIIGQIRELLMNSGQKTPYHPAVELVSEEKARQWRRDFR